MFILFVIGGIKGQNINPEINVVSRDSLILEDFYSNHPTNIIYTIGIPSVYALTYNISIFPSYFVNPLSDSTALLFDIFELDDKRVRHFHLFNAKSRLITNADKYKTLFLSFLPSNGIYRYQFVNDKDEIVAYGRIVVNNEGRKRDN
jgi:hypothetical protein